LPDVVCLFRWIIGQAWTRAYGIGGLVQHPPVPSSFGNTLKEKPVVNAREGGIMLQFIHPVFGDLMFDGIGLAGFLFALFLMWEALKEWRIRVRRARTARERAKGR
jgi:hypothetical protein